MRTLSMSWKLVWPGIAPETAEEEKRKKVFVSSCWIARRRHTRKTKQDADEWLLSSSPNERRKESSAHTHNKTSWLIEAGRPPAAVCVRESSSEKVSPFAVGCSNFSWRLWASMMLLPNRVKPPERTGGVLGSLLDPDARTKKVGEKEREIMLKDQYLVTSSLYSFFFYKAIVFVDRLIIG